MGSVGVAGLIAVVPAYIPAIARHGGFRAPWLVMAIFVVGTLFSHLYYRVRGRGNVGSLFTLLDSLFVISAMSVGIITTDAPISYGYSVLMVVVLIAVYARSFALTAISALMTGVPSVGWVALAGREGELVIVLGGYALSLWLSAILANERQLHRQNEGLKQAVSTSDAIAEKSMDLALASVGLSVGNLLHELRNQQMIVAASLSYLDEADPSDPEFKAAIVDAREAHAIGSRAVERTLAELKRKRKTAEQQFEVREAFSGLKTFSDKRFRVTVDPRSAAFYVKGDLSELAVVLENLVRNAQQAGATLVHVELRTEPSGESCVIEVRDNGPGLPPNAAEQLFRPFASFDKAYGTGLGLYLSKRRIEVMGGRLSLEHAAGGGARFIILLPGRSSPTSLSPAAQGDGGA